MIASLMTKHHRTTPLFAPHIFSLLALCFAICLAPSDTSAEPGEGERGEGAPMREGAQASSTMGDILARHGLSSVDACLTFQDNEALQEREEKWAAAILEMGRETPEELHHWLVGRAEPPAEVMSEAIFQRDCMFAALVQDAADPESALIVNYGDSHGATKHAMARVAKKYQEKKHFRDKIAQHFNQSHYRDAAGQAFIWYRKYTFSHPRSFNLISEDAAKKCGFTAGVSWKPDNERHQRCWKEHLSVDERQREILTASSAPGISRHHWGTEFDLYGLNPRRFLEGRDLYDEYSWMSEHALTHGFFQPFTGPDALGQHTYIEERWHWSYYPIAQALIAYIEDHPERYEEALDALWGELDDRWIGKKRDRSYFSYVKEHWRAYVLHTARLELSLLPVWMSPSSLLRVVATG